MYRFFDKHGKKVLAVASALLMVAFLAPATLFDTHGGGSGSAGLLEGKPLDVADLNQTTQALNWLQQLVTVIPQSQFEGPVALPDAFFGPDLNKQFMNEPITWYLLVREAQQAGVVPDERQVDDLLAPPTMLVSRDTGRVIPKALSEINPTVREGLKSNVRMMLSVRDHYQRSQQTIKISQPLLNDGIAGLVQKVRARLVIIDAAAYADKIPAPTEEDLKVQFEAYAKVAPGNPNSGTNPFGFGYLVPPRVRLQYISVPESELRKSVEASKTPEMWQEEAYIYYLKNKDRFAAIPAATQPTTTPSATTQASASTQPVVPPFEAIADKVTTEMRGPLIEAKRKAIVNRITQQLNADYQKASQNYTATTQKVIESRVGEMTLGDEKYLTRVRDEVQRQFGVMASVTLDAKLRTADELRTEPGIGSANLEQDNPNVTGDVATPNYLFSSLKQFAAATNDQTVIGMLDLYQPTKPLRGSDATYIARVVETSAAHPLEKMDEVKDQVERDLRRKLAFAEATKAADAVLAAANPLGLSMVPNQKVQTSGWIRARVPTIPDVPEAMMFAGELVEPILALQRGVASKAQLPKRDIVKLQPVNKVAVVELFDVMTEMTPKDAPAIRAYAGNIIKQQFMSPQAVEDWFNLESVSKRTGYVPADLPTGPTPDAPRRPAPGSPFIPG